MDGDLQLCIFAAEVLDLSAKIFNLCFILYSRLLRKQAVTFAAAKSFMLVKTK